MLWFGRRNYRRNLELQQPEFGRMINGQALGAVSKLRYGLCPMSFNGCEVIAVHNALVYLGRPIAVAEAAHYMERFRVLIGFFGCNAYKIGKALSHFGAANERVKNADASKAFIITFWTGVPLFSSVHTVFCIREDEKIRVCNVSNHAENSRLYGSVEEITGKYRPITIYRIQ